MVTHTAQAPSIAARVGLPLLTWGLPFHVAAMAILFGGLGLSAATVRSIAAWKEIAVVVLVATVIVRAATGRGPKTRLTLSDAWVGGIIAMAAIFFVAGESWFQLDLPRASKYLGFRDIAFYLLLYYVGRGTPEILSNPRTLRRFYLVAFVTAAIGLVEWVLVTPEQLVVLGVASYFQDFLGLSAFTTGNDYGLPHSYWTRIGGREIQRIGSVYLAGQGMAVPFLVLLPAATGWLVLRRKTLSVAAWAGYAVIWAGLLLTLTRVTIVACALQLGAFFLLLRRPIATVSAAATGVAIFLIGLVAVPGLAGFVWETLTWQSGSSRTHLQDWTRGYAAMLTHPFGAGLGTTDLAAVRAGVRPLAIDNQYLEYAVELGLLGLALHLLIFVAITTAAFRVMRESSDETTQTCAIVVAVTTLGILINALTAGVFNSLTLAYLYFWLAGALVTVSERLRVQRSGALALVGAAA
jgi:hypothetical protein